MNKIYLLFFHGKKNFIIFIYIYLINNISSFYSQQKENSLTKLNFESQRLLGF